MPGKAIGIQMNVGFPGTFARNADCIIASRMVKNVTGDSGPSFGDPCVLNTDNTYQSVADFIAAGRTAGSFTAALFAGVAAREVKTYQSYSANMPQIGGYAINQLADVIERGTVAVVCNVGSPTAGGAVYVRITANSGVAGSVVGGFEFRADDDSGKCILLTNCKWATGLIDSNKVAELAILTRNMP